MEKMASFPDKRVKDLAGLYFSLQKAGYAVRNVGADGFGTYIYMDDTEEKDPAPFVDEWVGRPAPRVGDARAFKERKAEVKQSEEAVAARAAEEAARVAALQAPEPDQTPSEPEASLAVDGEAQPPKESLIKRIFKVLW